MFTCEIPVHFGYVDQARIVYYPHFFHFCHIAMEEAFRAVVGIPYRDVLEKDRLGFPAVHIETDFETSVGYGETIRMDVTVERIGTSSVEFRYEGRKASDGARAFVARITTVAVNMDRFESVPVPPRYREGLARLKPKS